MILTISIKQITRFIEIYHYFILEVNFIRAKIKSIKTTTNVRQTKNSTGKQTYI